MAIRVRSTARRVHRSGPARAAVSAGLVLGLGTGCAGHGPGGSAQPTVAVVVTRTVTATPSAPAPAPTPVTGAPPVAVPSTPAVVPPTSDPSGPVSAPPPVRPSPVVTTAAGGGASALWGAQFHGTAQVSVQVYDHCSVDGSRRPSGSQTYSMPATLALDRPREGGGQREGNPFTLVLSVGQPSQVGAVSLWSSGVFAAPSGQLLLTFWKLSRDGGTLRGQLTDAHTQEGAGLNLVNWSGPLVACRPELGTLPIGTPHQVAVGTGLSGRLTAQSASLAVKGSSGDGVLDFSIDFTGSR